MILSKEEEAMACGRRGPGLEKCMDILVKFGNALGAERMVRISSAHTMPKEPPELLREMTDGLDQVRTFTTLHALMSAFDPHQWQKMGISEEFALKESVLHNQRVEIYRRLGFYQTYTCIPMFIGNLPRQGDCISWIGSGAQLVANSLLGARTNRDGTIVNLAAALTGCAPYRDLFLDAYRQAEVLVELDGLDAYQLTYTDWGAIGYFTGAEAQNRNVVFNGLPRELETYKLLGLIAPLAASGSVPVCHIVGVTPEAPTLRTALGAKKPFKTVRIGRKQLEETREVFQTDSIERVDMAVLGCPHCTLPEIKLIASFLEGRKISNEKRLWIGMPHQFYDLAQTMGYSAIIEEAGGVIVGSCMATIPDSPIPPNVEVLATNSFKAAHYISRLSKGRIKVLVRETEECIQAVTH
jgi:predicted aconitase